MFRFFVNKKEDNYFILDKKIVKHISVVRQENKNFICVFQKEFYLTKFEFPNRALILKKLDYNHENTENIVLAIAVLKTKAFEFAIQKATELGVNTIIPFYSQNVEQKLGNDIDKKLVRWQEIITHAAQQSFRNIIPVIEKPIKIKTLIENYQHMSNKFIAHEKENNNLMINSLFENNTIFLVGPEGGFTEDEVGIAENFGFQAISLGKRILRAETAAIFLLSRIKQ
ncbi:16S rRNA (uracil(1498)-N(3))-methyltransferase [Mesomycoplasma conjunctivae]|uniref:16S rRNA (uracil(1498)-N(3))-methyltransferase n=1 Tax=Mesomycoplasma conjunctivae TaxID=45361 RepID=UPI003DA5FF34